MPHETADKLFLSGDPPPPCALACCCTACRCHTHQAKEPPLPGADVSQLTNVEGIKRPQLPHPFISRRHVSHALGNRKLKPISILSIYY